MFEINERNKIFLTLGDTASLYLQVYDKAGNQREPEEGDVVTFSIDDTEYSVEASQTNDGRYVFNLLVNDIDAGVYSYRIVLVNVTSRYTIFEDEFIELLGEGEEESDEP